MRAGDFDRQITIQQDTPSRGTNGEEVHSWSTYKETSAKYRPMTARERFVSGSLHETGMAAFTVRYDPGIDQKMRIVFNGVNWRIIGMTEIGRRRGLEITAEEIRGSGI